MASILKSTPDSPRTFLMSTFREFFICLTSGCIIFHLFFKHEEFFFGNGSSLLGSNGTFLSKLSSFFSLLIRTPRQAGNQKQGKSQYS